MSFDKQYPNRKDWRAQYRRRSQRVDRSCRPGGTCPHCRGNRRHANDRRSPEDGD